MRRRTILGVLAGLNALVAALLAIAVNAATNTLPEFLDQHPGRAWALVAVLTIASIACAVAAVQAGQPNGAQPPAGARNKGIHAERNLSVRGRDHTILGGDDLAISPQQNPPNQPDGAQPAAGARNKGIHVGGNLNIDGQSHTVLGGDHVATSPQQQPPGEPKRRRRK
jgi:hypothetical protein